MNVSFEKYRCYNAKENSIEIMPINVLIGRNNSGKSSISDIIEFCSEPDKFSHRKDQISGISYKGKLNKSIIESTFQQNTSGGEIVGNHRRYGVNFIDKTIKVNLKFFQRRDRIETQISASKDNHELMAGEKLYRIWNDAAKRLGNPFAQYKVLRINAERDIRPEKDSASYSVESNGSGVTNLIHKFINFSKLDSKIVEETLLEALNTIIKPDSVYSDIVVQQIEKDSDKELFWEIFLEEENGSRIALSESGSGLKTIIIVLSYLFLLPVVLKKELKDIIFVFEELENNLHPALQRRLFNYIKNIILNSESKVIFTTHSHVAINIFDQIDEAQILHIVKNNQKSTIHIVDNTLNKYEVLNDLEVRASDILQSNGIIWVEGPSDRIYLNKWIEILSKGTIVENVHYQIMFYGGRLLSHLTFDNNEKIEGFIKLLMLNRNSAILIDSDKRAEDEDINPTKLRVKEELDLQNFICWITEGKEIENYLCENIINNALSLDSRDCFHQYDTIDNYLDKVKEGLGKKFLRDKVRFARKFTDVLDHNNINRYDLVKRVTELIKEIKKWNAIQE